MRRQELIEDIEYLKVQAPDDADIWTLIYLAEDALDECQPNEAMSCLDEAWDRIERARHAEAL